MPHRSRSPHLYGASQPMLHGRPWTPKSPRPPRRRKHMTDAEFTRLRIVMLELYIELWKVAAERVFHHAPDKRSDAARAMIVCMVVLRAELEGKPTNPSKVADELGLPRSTVRRKFDLLVQIHDIERKGRGYVVTANQQMPTAAHLRRYQKIF